MEHVIEKPTTLKDLKMENQVALNPELAKIKLTIFEDHGQLSDDSDRQSDEGSDIQRLGSVDDDETPLEAFLEESLDDLLGASPEELFYVPLEDPTEKYICQACGESFSSTDSLQTHEKANLVDKLQKCTECDEQFIGLCNLAKHKIIHNGEKHTSVKLSGKD